MDNNMYIVHRTSYILQRVSIFFFYIYIYKRCSQPQEGQLQIIHNVSAEDIFKGISVAQAPATAPFHCYDYSLYYHHC